MADTASAKNIEKPPMRRFFCFLKHLKSFEIFLQVTLEFRRDDIFLARWPDGVEALVDIAKAEPTSIIHQMRRTGSKGLKVRTLKGGMHTRCNPTRHARRGQIFCRWRRRQRLAPVESGSVFAGDGRSDQACATWWCPNRIAGAGFAGTGCIIGRPWLCPRNIGFWRKTSSGTAQIDKQTYAGI